MKRLGLILTLLALAMNVAAQSDTIVIKESKYDYIEWNSEVKSGSRKTTKYVWRIDIVNNSDENYLTWINRADNEDGYGDVNQMINFFRKRYMSLFYIWKYCEDTGSIIGDTFLKVIQPKESFSYVTIKKSEGEPKIKKRISIEKETVVADKIQYYCPISKCHDNRYFYNQDIICLIDE